MKIIKLVVTNYKYIDIENEMEVVHEKTFIGKLTKKELKEKVPLLISFEYKTIVIKINDVNLKEKSVKGVIE